MISTNDLRNGITIMLEGQPHRVMEFQHVKPGKGPAFVRTKMKNLFTGSIYEKTLRAGEKVEQANVMKKEMQFLYVDGDSVVLMDNKTFEQLNVPIKAVADVPLLLREGETLEAVVYNEVQVVDVELPQFVIHTITTTDPAVKGDTVSGATKNATTETGFTTQVPLFVDEGQKIKINTQSKSYVERAN